MGRSLHAVESRPFADGRNGFILYWFHPVHFTQCKNEKHHDHGKLENSSRRYHKFWWNRMGRWFLWRRKFGPYVDWNSIIRITFCAIFVGLRWTAKTGKKTKNARFVLGSRDASCATFVIISGGPVSVRGLRDEVDFLWFSRLRLVLSSFCCTHLQYSLIWTLCRQCV